MPVSFLKELLVIVSWERNERNMGKYTVRFILQKSLLFLLERLYLSPSRNVEMSCLAPPILHLTPCLAKVRYFVNVFKV